jgi:RHS repeat-associated protein
MTLCSACHFSVAAGNWSISTGKIRDTETGNDYFGARYYTGSVSRFMSPDWSAKVEPVPYSKLDNPQTLNLYAYVMNSPMTRFDVDGHAPLSWGGFQDCSERGDCGSNPALALQNHMANQANIEANKTFVQREQARFSRFVSNLRLVVTSDTAQAGIRDVVYKVSYLSRNGNLQDLSDKIGAEFKKLDVTENNSAYCAGCSKDAAGVYHSSDRDGNRFEDLVSPQPAGNRLQSFTASPHDGGPSAPISVRLAGQDYGTIGQWSDGIHIPYINGYSYQQGLPGGYAPTQ